MALEPIITLPDPKLRLRQQNDRGGERIIASLIDDMIETMHDAPGVQRGSRPFGWLRPIRLLVVDTAKKRRTADPQVFVDPVPAWCRRRSTYEESC